MIDAVPEPRLTVNHDLHTLRAEKIQVTALRQRVDEVKPLFCRTVNEWNIQIVHFHGLQWLILIEQFTPYIGLRHPDLRIEQRIVTHAWA